MHSHIPWSFSSWSAYQTCPRQFYELKVAKNFPFIETEAIKWGNVVHKAMEDYITDGAELPQAVKRFKPLVDRIVDKPGDTYAELALACTIDLKPTGFWDADAWCRGKGDILKVSGRYAFNGDWKTGKVKPNSLQLDLMAVLTFAKFPAVEECGTAFLWLQQPSKPTIAKHIREDIPILLEQFEQGLADMEWSFKNNAWPEKPSGLCRGWCPVKTCKHWKPMR